MVYLSVVSCDKIGMQQAVMCWIAAYLWKVLTKRIQNFLKGYKLLLIHKVNLFPNFGTY